MINYLNCKTIKTSIKRAEKLLIDKAIKNDGVYENFGYEEIKAIEDKFVDTSDYSDESQKKWNLLESFKEWCSTYTLNTDKTNSTEFYKFI